MRFQQPDSDLRRVTSPTRFGDRHALVSSDGSTQFAYYTVPSRAPGRTPGRREVRLVLLPLMLFAMAPLIAATML